MAIPTDWMNQLGGGMSHEEWKYRKMLEMQAMQQAYSPPSPPPEPEKPKKPKHLNQKLLLVKG